MRASVRPQPPRQPCDLRRSETQKDPPAQEGARCKRPLLCRSTTLNRRLPGKEGTRRRDPEAEAQAGRMAGAGTQVFYGPAPCRDHAPGLSPTPVSDRSRPRPVPHPLLNPGCANPGPYITLTTRRFTAQQSPAGVRPTGGGGGEGAGEGPSTGPTSLTLGLWPAGGERPRGGARRGRPYASAPAPAPVPAPAVLGRKCSLSGQRSGREL